MSILSSLRRRLPWFAGALTPWVIAWLLLGLRQVPSLVESPHPFLKGMKLTGVVLEAVREWALLALFAYLIVGLLTALITLTWTGMGQKEGGQVGSLSFWEGTRIGVATLFWTHGVLFLWVPATLGTIAGLKSLPVGLDLLLLLGLGALLILRYFPRQSRWWYLRWVGCLVTLTGLLYIPHDVFRRMAPSSASLSSKDRRLLVLGVDSLQKTLVDQAYRRGGAPAGVEPVCAVPATRMAWNSLLGGNPDLILRDILMPYRSEIDNPGRLALLEYGREKGLRVAFVIDDALTPTYGLQPTYFSEIMEPSGGWKHWFSLGLGHTWPIYSWAENYCNPVETNNPWSDTEAFFRDVGRSVQRNHWTNAHLCELHEPIFSRFAELQELGRWTWLLQSPSNFISYQTFESAQKDRFRKVGKWSDPKEHYLLRTLTILRALRPHLDQWTLKYPSLSGVLTADHGETHVEITDGQGRFLTHLPGVHGFLLDADSIRVPMYPFGQTKPTLGPGSVYSWFNLRDDIGRWASSKEGPLEMTADEKGWLIQSPTVRPTHLEGSSQANEEADERGIRPDNLASLVFLTPMGTWYAEDPPKGKAPWKLSTALARGDRLITFNPIGKGKQMRTEFQGYRPVDSHPVSDEDMAKEVSSFQGHVPKPWTPPTSP